MAADGGERAYILKAERLARGAGNAGADVGRCTRTHLLGPRCGAGYRFAISHDAGQIANHEHLVMAGHRKIEGDQHAAGAVDRRTQALAQR